VIGGVPVIAFEGVDSRTLAHRLERGPLRESEALALLKRGGSAPARRLGFVHRHICPSQVLTDDVGDPLQRSGRR
jgi:hypothetical protein